MGEIAVMNRSGDNKLIWDANDAIGTGAAKTMYDELTAKGYAAFAVKKNGDKAERITAFDKSLEKIILVPPMKGG